MVRGPPATAPAASAGSLTATTMASGGPLYASKVRTISAAISGRPLVATTTSTRSLATGGVIVSVAQTRVADRSAPGKPEIKQRRRYERAGIKLQQADDVEMREHADGDRKRHHTNIDDRHAGDFAEIAGVLHQNVRGALGDAGSQQHEQYGRHRRRHGRGRPEQQREQPVGVDQQDQGNRQRRHGAESDRGQSSRSEKS